MNRKISLYLIIFYILKSHILYAQSVEKPTTSFDDSLKYKTYEELYTSFYYNIDNDTLYDIYSQEFLRKAYREKDTLKIAGGYFIITIRKKDKYFKFYDSLIKYSMLINENEILWKAYDRKGDYYTDKREFKKALESEIEAYKVAEKYEYEEYIDRSSVSLGILKEKIGKNKEALKDFKRSFQYTSKLIANIPLDSIDKRTGNSHLNRLHLLSNSYRLNGKLDSANKLNKDIQKYKRFKWAKRNINKIRLNAAEIHYDKAEYQQAIDSALMAIPQFLDRNNLKSVAVCYYIEGMSLIKLKNKQDGIIALGKMDSIYNILGNIYPASRPGYEFLKKHYEKTNDIHNQLYYVKQLLRFDSIAHTNYAYISEEIVDKIDKVNLLKQQDNLQNQLNKSKKSSKKSIIIGSIILVLLSFEIIRRRNIIKKKSKDQELLHKYYQEKFDKLLANQLTQQVQKPTKDNQEKEEELGIAEEVVTPIINALKLFEEKKTFTDANITATTLAKDLNTNANYLGRIIKHYNGKSFRTYLNDLRIDLALERLRNNKSFKKYSIQAMAKEVGFKNSEPFSKSFKNRTGYYPSDFIDQLNN